MYTTPTSPAEGQRGATTAQVRPPHASAEVVSLSSFGLTSTCVHFPFLFSRDCEIDELRTQLYRMQEDWIEEECHRIEAQLALKEARKEIQHLHEVMESVRSNLGREQEPHETPKQYSGLHGARPGGRSRSCGCSPASTLSRSTTRMSSEALQLERGANAPESGRASRPAGQTHLLLEAALLTEPGPQQAHLRAPPSVPRSATFERLCTGGAMLPVSHSCHTLSSTCQCSGHSYLPHHHLFLHLPQEEPPQTAAAAATPVSDPIPIPTPSPAAEKKPEVRSQACSPTMTWLCEETAAEEEELSVISLPTVDIITPSDPQPLQTPLPAVYPPEHLYKVEPLPQDVPEEITKKPAEPRTCQPQSAPPLAVRQEATLLEMDEDTIDEPEGTNEDSPPPQLCHWSRYFLVDLLALAMPVVPTVAWLCRGAPREVMPVYHIGSLLRGCCAVALHSLRRRGAGRGRRPASMNGTTSI